MIFEINNVTARNNVEIAERGLSQIFDDNLKTLQIKASCPYTIFISPYKHSQAGCSKMPPRAIFNNCQNNKIINYPLQKRISYILLDSSEPNMAKY